MSLKRLAGIGVSILSVTIAMFHLYTGAFGIFDALTQRPVHLLLLVALSFCVYPFLGREELRYRILDLALVILTLSTLLYILINHDRFMDTVLYVDRPLPTDWIFTILAVVLVLEAARRSVGKVLPLLALIFLVAGYLFATIQISPTLNIPKIQDWWWIHALFISTQGLWGIPTMVSATFIFLFVVLAALLEATKVGRFFLDFSLSLVGKSTGGPGKVAVISSSLFGSISGSAAANVYATGVFTIPTMKKFGFDRNFAGAVEVVASTGGQLMPPIMGAGAFVMAEFLGIPYIRIAAAAIIPAMLYYLAAFFAVHAESKNRRLMGLPPEQVRPLRVTLKEELGQFASFAVTIGALVYMLMTGFSLYRAVFISIMILLIVSFLRKETRLGPLQMWNALDQASRNAIMIAMACGVASIIVGVLTLTGLGVMFSKILVDISHGNVYILLISAAFLAIILGMGMPTTAAYILAAALIAPALIASGVEKLPAHFYVFTFAIYSTITPPVALAAYAAANVSGGNPIKIALTAMKMVIPSFIIPVRYVLHPAILLVGSPFEILLDIALLIIAVLAIEASVFSWPIKQTFSRATLIIGGLLIVLPIGALLPGVSTIVIDIVGFALIAIGLVPPLLLYRRK
ncbi:MULTISPECIES: TRAP transporter permease [unclassified Archaeoglobus]|jgi:TRAP transporter 4TM/12TM fusion protein|uniref:TRAP transporter permease n=1 Tax=unclassified Archaeoglobus TaxID=2643606 RepID=UPI0025C23986|nr:MULTISPECIES: TRAP transporter fused permease subunit [unclassified Archaeoglobus]